MTRTIFVGTPTVKDRALYKLVLEAKTESARSARSHTMCADADMLARKTFGSYKKYFIHTLGHGVGKRIHERPRLYYKATEDMFLSDMIVTIEPGIYIPNKLGIRIEDTYVVTNKGLQALTLSSQKLFVFKAQK